MRFRALLCGMFLTFFASGAAFVAVSPAFAQSRLAEPAPTPEKPRRIVLQLTSDDPKIVNSVLNNAINLQKFYGPDRVEVAVVVFGPGMEALYEKTSPVTPRVSSLIQYDVSFVGCANTMEATGHKADELIQGVKVAPSGAAEIVERQLQGWTYVRP